MPVPDLSFLGDGANVIKESILIFALVIGLEIVVMYILQNYIRLPNWIFKIVLGLVLGVTFIYLLFNQYLPNIINGL